MGIQAVVVKALGCQGSGLKQRCFESAVEGLCLSLAALSPGTLIYLTTSPHGLPPVAMRRSTVPVARSTTDTSPDGPFAV